MVYQGFFKVVLTIPSEICYDVTECRMWNLTISTVTVKRIIYNTIENLGQRPNNNENEDFPGLMALSSV